METQVEKETRLRHRLKEASRKIHIGEQNLHIATSNVEKRDRELAVLERKLEKRDADVVYLSKVNEDLKVRWEKAQQMMEERNIVLTDLADRHAQNSDVVVETELKARALQKELAAKAKREREVSLEANNTRAEADSLKFSLHQRDKKVEELSAQLHQARAELMELHSESSKLNLSTDRMKNELKDSNEKLERANKQLEGTKKELEKAKDEAQHKERHFSQAERKICKTFHDTVSESHMKLVEIDNDRRSSHMKIVNLERQMKLVQDDNLTLLAENSHLKEQMVEAKHTNESLIAEVERSRYQANKYKYQESMADHPDVVKLRCDLNNMRAEVKDANEKRKQTEKAFYSIKKEIILKEAELKACKEELQASRLKSAASENFWTSQQQKTAKAEREKKQVLLDENEAKVELRRAKKKINQLVAKNNDLERRLEDAFYYVNERKGVADGESFRLKAELQHVRGVKEKAIKVRY